MLIPSRTPSVVLDQPIAKGHALRVRDIVLNTAEMMIVKQLSKSAIEVHLRALKQSVTMEGETPEEARQNLVPATVAQFKKLAGFLQEDTAFYVACCCPCSTTDENCPICNEDLWTVASKKGTRRPKALFFVRSVRSWLEKLLGMPMLQRAIDEYRKRKPLPDIYSDYLDGDYVKELISSGMCLLVCEIHKNLCPVRLVSPFA